MDCMRDGGECLCARREHRYRLHFIECALRHRETLEAFTEYLKKIRNSYALRKIEVHAAGLAALNLRQNGGRARKKILEDFAEEFDVFAFSDLEALQTFNDEPNYNDQNGQDLLKRLLKHIEDNLSVREFPDFVQSVARPCSASAHRDLSF